MSRNGLNENIAQLCPPPPNKFTQKDWNSDLLKKCCCVEGKNQLSDRLVGQSECVVNATDNICRHNKTEVDHQIGERINAIEFMKQQLEHQRAISNEEIGPFLFQKSRLIGLLEKVNNAYNLCLKCIAIREGRLGIDLTLDVVERELQKEKCVLEGVKSLLNKLLAQNHEQVRLLRSRIYFIDKDLEDKAAAAKIDKRNATLNNSSCRCCVYQGCRQLDPWSSTPEEWEAHTNKNKEEAFKETNSARQLRSNIDVLYQQAVSDLQLQHAVVNDALHSRVQEYRDSKMKFEMKHAETVQREKEMLLNIAMLEKALVEKQGYLALAHTRLGNRANRPRIELCKDQVNQKLMLEQAGILYSVGKIQQIIAECRADIRYLSQAQIQLEEDINIKMNSIKLDNVDCFAIRQAMAYS